MATCDICGRELTNPVSVGLGIGPECRMKHKQADREKDMFNEADFSFHMIKDVLVIVDLDNGAKSVTNDIETVLEKIQAQGVDLTAHQIMYKDSMEIFDGISVDAKGKFRSFYSIGLKDEAAALEKIGKPQTRQMDKHHEGQPISGFMRYQGA